MTPASLVRIKASVGSVTILLDEMGDALSSSPELDTVLRSGFQRGKDYIRLRALPDGGYEHECFEVFLPAAISLVGAVRKALGDRSAHVLLLRKPTSEVVDEAWDEEEQQQVTDIGRKLARWVEDEGDLLSLKPARLEGVNDRQADFVRPLLAIADQAGGNWPIEARKALQTLLGEGADLTDDTGSQLINDLRTIFDAELAAQPKLKADKQEIESKLLVDRLLEMAESPWARLGNGRPLTQYKLSFLLRSFAISPCNIGPESRRRRGYRRTQFLSAWEAYPPPQSPFAPKDGLPVAEDDPPVAKGDFGTSAPQNDYFSSCTPLQGSQPAQNGGNPPDFGDFQGSQQGPAVNPEKDSNPAEIRHSVETVNSGGGSQGGKKKNRPPSYPKDARPAVGASAPDVLTRLIHDLAANHPNWDAGRIARKVGQPVAVIKRMLATRVPSDDDDDDDNHTIPAAPGTPAAPAAPVANGHGGAVGRDDGGGRDAGTDGADAAAAAAAADDDDGPDEIH
jgi:hypothetical protein